VARAAEAAAALAEALRSAAGALTTAPGASPGPGGPPTAPPPVPDAPAGSTPRPDGGARVAERQRETATAPVAAPSAPSAEERAPVAPGTPADGTSPSPCAADDESGARRTPLALPGGVFDDSIEAAEHLLRVPGAALVVDGYNVTMFGWPELGKSAQRSRLLNALSDLALRTATDVELVFDGAEVEALPAPPSGGARVRVRFSPPDIEADDVIIDLVGCIPAVTPVIVASSDNRVRAGVQRLGANVLHNHQLVGVLRR
jgi:predicted RNA-binding protein with PIN domain